MAEFKAYIERRERTEAVQISDAAQVEWVAQLLGATDYTLHGDGWDFHIDLVIFRGAISRGEQMIEARINRGDFIIRDKRGGFEIVPLREFVKAWEEERV